MVRTLLSILILGSTVAFTVRAQVTDTRSGVIAPGFHTLQIHVQGDEMASPVIMLGSDDRLTVSFDELAPDMRYMRYELIHCDALWRPDALVGPEFLDGFNEAQVEDYAFSQATLTQYVNYRITIPNAQIRPKLSGNYLLRVYDESDPSVTLVQARFSVCEPAMRSAATVSSRTDVDYNDTRQQITLSVDTRTQQIHNVFNDLIVTVTQNGRLDNMAVVRHPSRVAGTVLWYEHVPELIFNAGNEYRRMEIVSTSYPGMGVEGMSYADPYYHATLYTDLPRNADRYSYDQTQFGRFRIRQFNSSDPDTEAEYIVTHFALEAPEMRNADVFLDGDFTCRRFDPESRMVYNRAAGRYEHAILLKQGAYNYQYLTVPNMSTRGATAPVEGDLYQTVNEYTVMVYHRPPGSRYDRLVTYTRCYSGR